MPITRPAVPNPKNVQLGAGVLVFNFNPDDWDAPETIAFGAVRGGGSYNVEPTNKPIRFDGDRGEDSKGLKRKTEQKIQITVTALELDHAKLKKNMPGKVTNVTNGVDVPEYNKYRPKVDYDEEDYIENLAYITSNVNGDVVAYVIENVLGDGALSMAFTDKDEVVAETTFTAHFDYEQLDDDGEVIVPTYIVQYESETAT
ncbi:hypothetical protein ACM26V_00450 [Salipaludibacillus sp. HK11]|uniref:hypothetical protein n=1 Tax=Salipaludibacillus sp. HK11 TaxID=3394320 RepID=UPI0039FC54C8